MYERIDLTMKHVEHVFPKKPTFGYKGTLIQRFIGGPNIVLLSGHDWRKHRRVYIDIAAFFFLNLKYSS